MQKPGEIIIPFDQNKLDAIKQFSSESELPIEDELTKAAEKIYGNRVPIPVRQYIDKLPVPPPKTRKLAPKAAAPVNANE